MQKTIVFPRITAEEALQQRIRHAASYAEEHPPLPAPPPKRPPGRPKRPLPLPVQSSKDEQINEQRKEKRQNTNWFSSPFIFDVIAAYERCDHSAKRALQYLKLHCLVPNRYAQLSDSTIRSWFDDKHRLLPRFQAQLDVGTAATRGGRRPMLSAEIEEEVKRVLMQLRETGTPINTHTIRWTMMAIFREKDASLLSSFRLSRQWISYFMTNRMQWSWRKGTTAASHLPADWEQQGIDMAKRAAAVMAIYSIHPSLIVNMDQTGVHLVPASSQTYAPLGTRSVPVAANCLPTHTISSRANGFHLTHSTNHWSCLETMKQWIRCILIPYKEKCIGEFNLRADAHILLVLDVWAVHKSEEFRLFLRMHYPYVHLVYIPARCTSKLQVADVVLQRPFKSFIRRSFNQWAAERMHEKLKAGLQATFHEYMGMKTLKPLLLQWCVDSFEQLQQNRALIAAGWQRCMSDLYDICDPSKRVEAMAQAARHELELQHIPSLEEEEKEEETEEETDSSGDELDLSRPLPEAERRSTRQRNTPQRSGYFINSEYVVMTEDSDASK
jgi:hypothetical protein